MRAGVKGIVQGIVVLAVVTGSFLAASYLASLREKPESLERFEQIRPAVETKTVEPTDHRIRFNATGTVRVQSFVNIVPQVSGKVTWVSDHLSPGGVFEKSTPLFRVERADFLHRVQRLEAEVARSETQLQLQLADANASVAAWRGLHPDRAPPPLVAKRPQLKEARAAVKAAKANLATARLNLERTRFALPFQGRVVESSLGAGQFVTSGQSYGRAYSLKALEIEIPLENREIRWLREARDPELTVHSDYHGEPRTYRAFVKRFAAQADRRTRFTRVYLGLKEPSTDLIPGVFVTVEIVGALKRDVWVLPLSALHAGNTVWSIDARNRLKRLTPKILQISKDYVVAAGNGSMEQVVTSPLPQITENTKVRVLDDASGK